jgi:hypothetical protein
MGFFILAARPARRIITGNGCAFMIAPGNRVRVAGARSGASRRRRGALFIVRTAKKRDE